MQIETICRTCGQHLPEEMIRSQYAEKAWEKYWPQTSLIPEDPKELMGFFLGLAIAAGLATGVFTTILLKRFWDVDHHFVIFFSSASIVSFTFFLVAYSRSARAWGKYLTAKARFARAEPGEYETHFGPLGDQPVG